ncbi:PREDICTED: LOW QUALITY PROTEIN: solute carrier organic anion transporter family member 2A1-like [Branchiostoma belcheri]|uniref:Solute carrier organic anion transporter family member n=1 Tax=Branchiostoma belcheri TaxID=7741 RepID=A0A6P4Y204_BRABE|nr:PREDICTED: LOW QUALITY PROTEIN: solute carrier organic anion transporter family member 2A1-like [Branchiostoma belcheri]
MEPRTGERTNGELPKKYDLLPAGDEDSREARLCGLRGWRPSCLQRLATVRWYLLFFCLLMFFEGFVQNGYFKGVLTSIEKQFKLTSSSTGSLASGAEFSALCVVVFFIHLGGRSHRPVILGLGACSMGLGAFFMAMPHFFMGNYDYEAHSLDNATNTCHVGHSEESDVCTAAQESAAGGGSYYGLLMLGELLIGAGSTPMMTIGVAYLDDHAPKNSASLYISVSWFMLVLSPAAGFIISAVMVNMFVDIDRVDLDSVTITPSDPRWIGAWWLGLLIGSFLLFLVSVPFFFFPRALPKPEDDTKDPEETKMDTIREEDEDEDEEKVEDLVFLFLAGFFQALKRILFNLVFISVNIMGIFEINITHAVIVFLPKYMELTFSLSASAANFLVGVASIPGAAVGIILGGYLVKRFKWGMPGCINFCFGTQIVSFAMFCVLYTFECPNMYLAGVTLPYVSFYGVIPGLTDMSPGLVAGNTSNISMTSLPVVPTPIANSLLNSTVGEPAYMYSTPPHHHEMVQSTVYKTTASPAVNNTGMTPPWMINITLPNMCNGHCGCQETTFEPVCGADWITYFSPCFAGCTGTILAADGITPSNYTGCACIKGGLHATPGVCPTPCSAKAVPFVVFMFFLAIVTAVGQAPAFMVLIRAVDIEDKPFALGLQYLATRLFASIPAPIYFGAAIDTSCMMWSTVCGKRGSCWLYDNTLLRQAFVGVGIGLKAGALVWSFVAFMAVRRQSTQGPEEEEKSPSRRLDSLSMGDVIKASQFSLDMLDVNLNFTEKEFMEAKETVL